MVAQEEGTAINGLATAPHRHEVLVGNKQQGISTVYPGSMLGSNMSVNDAHKYTDNYFYQGTLGPIIKNTTVQLTSTDTETRPENYTVRIWKRVS